MSISEDDRSYYTPDPHRQPSLPSDYEPSPVRYSRSVQNGMSHTPEPTSNARYSIAPLPALVYTSSPRSAVKRSPTSAAFEQYASNASVNGFTSEPPNDEYSSDPHEFYRRYRDPFGRGLGEPLGQADIVVASREEGMTTSKLPHRESPVSARSNGTNLASRLYDHPVFRSSPSALANKSRSSQPKLNPSLTSPLRNRQTSLKELVNKFNQTPDEIPPLPRKSATHNSIRVSSAAPGSAPFARGRTSSQSKGSGARFVSQESSSGAEQLPRPSKVGQRRRRRDSGISPSPTSTQSSRSQLQEESIASDTFTSHLLGNQKPKEEESSRKPLFGELLMLDTDTKDSGYGIPRPWRRRGSEGSMHSPNPMFSDYLQDQDLLISPTSWSPILITSSEDMRSGKNPIPHSPGLHRRTRSDIASASKPNAPSALGKHVLVMSPPQDQPSVTSPSIMNRNPQSRIPISTRRTSITSESGDPATSTRPNSIISRTTTQRVQSPQRSTASVESLQQSASPSRTPRPTPVKTTPRHNHGLTIQHVKPNSLHAIITATSTQKSPPLRGSRTRQPVSTASTAASRARTAERFGHSERDPKGPRDGRPKKLPELGHVDFAARRQAISQAFTKSVQENERKEELEAERRLTSRTSLGLQDRGRDEGFEEPGEASGVSDFSSIAEEQSNNEDAPESKARAFEDVSQVLPKTERDLTINTAHLSERSVLDLSQEDSPTLGLDDQFGTMDHGEGKDLIPPSDAEPLSAVTASTNDTADTFFDNEPQEDEASPLEDHQSLLSHIMSMRESSPASRTSMRQVVATEGSDSDKDDKVSIHIMLRNTPVEAHAEENDNLYGDLFKRSPPKEKLEVKAESASCNVPSTSQEHQSDNHNPKLSIENIDEHPAQAPGESAHTSYSTTVSTTVSSDTQQPWSPGPLSSPATDRSTLDSDTYSTINGILNHYHDPSVLSPDMMNGLQEQMMRQTPELAKQGGWDPKKVTQLYLQKFAHGRFAQTNVIPEPLNSSMHRRHVPQSTPSNQIRNSRSTTPSHEQSTTKDIARVSLEVARDGNGLQRASLNNADDWASASPSIMDYMPHQADNGDSPEESIPPPLPPKNDQKAPKKDGATDTNANYHSPASSRPELPTIQGTGGTLGLAINIESPHDADPPQFRKPPSLPGYAPPPPPEIAAQSRPSNEYVQHPSTDYSSNGRAKGSKAISPLIGGGEIPYQIPVGDGSVDSPGIVLSSDQTSKANSPTPDQKRLTRRKHIIKELVDTEHSFGQDMKVVDDIYKGTSNVIIVPAEDVKVLFGNSDQVVAFSTNFLDALKQASKSVYVLPKSKRWRSKRSSVATSNSGDTEDQSSVYGPELNDDERDRTTFVGEAFGHHMPQMEKVYAEYLKNHDAANQKLQALQRNPNVQIWLKECRAYAHDLTTAWDLDSLLVKPVQRVLKYPLLLDQLLDATPENHPDYTALDIAARGMKGLSMRINEMKKRADLMEQVTNRKRKDSDVRLFKGLINRTERLKQKVGTTDIYQDKEYSAVVSKFGTNFFQLQVVMRDVEMYTSDVQGFVTRFCDFVMAIEAYMDVGQTSYPETESKWRKFRLTSREITMTALTDHIAAVRKNVINPMTTLIQLHNRPQKLMQLRNKKVLDFIRCKAIKDRGDKPDKKVSDLADVFIALNDTLKDELTKLFAFSGKLIEACLNNFVQLQLQWQSIWKRKLTQAVDLHNVPGLSEIIESFSGDFAFTEAQVLSLGICNGSMLAEAVNLVGFLSPTTTLNDDLSSPMRPPTLDSARNRTFSQSSNQSPVLPQPDFGGRHSGGSFTFAPMPMTIDNQITPARSEFGRRVRTDSNTSGNSQGMHEMPGAHQPYGSSSTLQSIRPSTSTNRGIDPPPSLPRLSVDTPGFNRLSDDPANIARTSAPTTYYTAAQSDHLGASTSESSYRYSGAFQSAMPMSESPRPSSPADSRGSKEFYVMFLAASIYEFKIDRSRKEGGYPYLTYVAGEIFDVVGEKGELWLAKNQDDATNTIGWIWTKHFVQLASS